MLLFSAMAYGADVAVLNGNVDLVISSATAGQEPDVDSDQTAQLEWNNWPGTSATKKITVQTNLASPNFTLKVQALNITAATGTSAGEVTLTTISVDLISSIPAMTSPDVGTCDLRYTATATASDGINVDTHTITYTIVDE
ncbi:hypothetical protein KKC97_09235 [bacterium]|nr:hypothetical protein [bacterium]MBU1637834.1 hypothetical protein [bacterium]MBU1919705.1 hypothetical protein [bacterium]